jgi:hypothetical protein
MKTTFFSLAIYLHLIFPPQFYAAEESNKSLVKPSRQQILDCVKRFTAWDESFAIASVESVSLSELQLPFLSHQLQDQTGIRIRFEPGKIKLPGGFDDPYMRYFTIYLDADARQLLGVKSRLAERSPDIHDGPSVEEVETRLRAAKQIYESFPLEAPKVSFMDALESVRAGSLSSPRDAQEIDGFYLMYKAGDQKPYPVWIIYLRGLPPMHMMRPFGGPQPPVWTRNHTHSIVDAVTGKCIVSGNSAGVR